jgi:hypothetical protein
VDKPLLIWSPVISAQLNEKHRIKGVTKYRLDNKFNSVEDVKIKVRQSEAIIQGHSVQVFFKLEILCLLEDEMAELKLITWYDQCNEKLSITEFDRAINNNENVYMKLTNIDCEGFGELLGKEIHIDFYINYSIIATREQIIEISPAVNGEKAADALKAALEKLESEVAHVENENGQLRKQLFFYERDITSLKRGLWKAENRNAILNRERKEHQALIEKLQSQLRQNINTDKSEHSYYTGGSIRLNTPEMRQEDQMNLGSRIKRMFMNSL